MAVTIPPGLRNKQPVVFEPRGEGLTLLYSKEPEILFEGPAGTGKSRTALEKAYIAAKNYPGMRGLFVRQTRKSITQSIQVTFEEEVMKGGIKLGLHGRDQHYKFPNGSRIVVGGMADPDNIMSSQYDLIFVNEGTELSAESYEKLLTRNRNGVMPYQQIIVDCNPGPPNHWLNLRAASGAMQRLKGVHEDNPRYFNKDGTMTEQGRAYMGKLDSLTGVRYKRLRLGLWVAAEGQVYPEYEPERHVIRGHRVPAGARRWITVDFGFRDPFVAQWWYQDPRTGMLVCYREIYKTERLVQDHAHQMYAYSYGEPIQGIITDHDLEDRMTLEKHWHRAEDCHADSSPGIPTIKADKDIATGLEAVRARLSMPHYGIAFFEDRLVELDQELKDQGRPTSTTEEFESYVWDTRESEKMGIVRKEVPLDKDNHGMDSCRYLVKHVDGGNFEQWRHVLSQSSTMTVSTAKPHPDDILDAWRRLLS